MAVLHQGKPLHFSKITLIRPCLHQTYLINKYQFEYNQQDRSGRFDIADETCRAANGNNVSC